MDVDSPEDLYGLPLDRFISERAALVKALRGEKRREEASEVAALKKPSVAAWAVNQLVRTQPKGLRALFDAGDDLVRAQAQAAAGKGGGDAMREATHRQRDAVRQLLEAGEGLLNSAGQALSQATMERVGETLGAAAFDEEARRQVTGGCLTHELRFVGVGIEGLAPPSEDKERNPRPAPRKEKPRKEKPRQSAANTGQAQAERAAARRQAAALKDARQTEARARRAATRAQKELAAAEARHEVAAASLRDAETLLATAADQAQEAEAQLAAAEQATKELGRS